LARELNVTCSSPCKVRVYRKYENVSVVDAATEKTLVEQIKLFQKAAAKPLKNEKDLEAFQRTANYTALAFVEKLDSAEYRNFATAARRILQAQHKDVSGEFKDTYLSFGVAIGKDLERHRQSLPALQLFTPHNEEGEPVDFDGSMAQEDLERWLQLESQPLVQPYNYNLRDKFEKLTLPPVHLFLPDGDKDITMYKAVAAKFRKKLAFVSMGTRNSYMMEDFALETSALPAVGIADSFQYDSKKFAMAEAVSEEALVKFCEDYLARNLKAALKSEPPPTEPWKAGKVQKVVAKTLPETVAAEKATFLSVHKPWAQDKGPVEEVQDKVAEFLGDLPAVSIGRMDSNKNGIDEDGPMKQYAELASSKADLKSQHFLLPGGGKAVITFDGVFTTKAVLSFLKANLKEVAAGWEKIEIKIRAKAEAEEARKKAEQEKLNNARKVVIEGTSGGIVKHVFEEGTGGSPKPGDKVKAHYTGTLLNGDKFDSSRDRGTPFDFTLGQGQVIKCWDQGFATMKKGEKALLTCTAPYSYGDRGSPPKIPGGATLKFDVELISFTSASGKKEL